MRFFFIFSGWQLLLTLASCDSFFIRPGLSEKKGVLLINAVTVLNIADKPINVADMPFFEQGRRILAPLSFIREMRVPAKFRQVHLCPTVIFRFFVKLVWRGFFFSC